MVVIVFVLSMAVIVQSPGAQCRTMFGPEDHLMAVRPPPSFWAVRLATAAPNSSLEGVSSKMERRASAAEVADRYGCRVVRTIDASENTYLFERLPDHVRSSSHKRSHSQHQAALNDDVKVTWADVQVPLRRTKRDFDGYPADDAWTKSGEYSFVEETDDYRSANGDASIERIFFTRNTNTKLLASEDYSNDTDELFEPASSSRPIDWFSDELWPLQWYLQDRRHRNGAASSDRTMPNLDLNVLAVYAKGISGKGVRVAVLDDGLEHQHEDLAPNYDPSISRDINNDRPDPTPERPVRTSSHGTRCAGEIAMAANNGKCGVGVAFNAAIGGIKMLAGRVFDAIEGMALGYAVDRVDVYSASWGPSDSGRSLERPGRLAQSAIQRGVRDGRGGRGAVYVWASGNGRANGDNCNCDGYAASRLTVTIGSASQSGELPWYGERCPAILAVTYSSGSERDQMIATTDVQNQCTVRHTGTSASAPLAAGIIALALEANPDLGWRDVQHLIVMSSDRSPLAANPGWIRNAAGLQYSTSFGFGLMNAAAFVGLATASNWTNRPPAESYAIPIAVNAILRSDGTAATVRFQYTGPIVAVEHVEVTVNVAYPVRGAIAIYLTSARGTQIQLLSARWRDDSSAGFVDWTLMSVATWAEDPRGEWRLEIVDEGAPNADRIGRVGKCVLTVHGTTKGPPDADCESHQ